MKAPEDHAAYFEGFEPECTRPTDWTEESWLLLKRYGRWYTALVSGELAPITEAQERFVTLFRGNLERDLEEPHETLWDAYQKCLRRGDVDDSKNISARNSGMSLRVPRNPSAPPRLDNGDDDVVYFQRRRRR